LKDTFKFENIENFDNHINLSIPNYSGLVNIFSAFVYEFTTPSGYCIDLGCSTGSFLAQAPKIDTAYYVGVDSVLMDHITGGWSFIQNDIATFMNESPKEIDVIVLMFTLQFLGNKKRNEVISRLKDLVNNGTTILVSEKVYIDDSKINAILDKNHKVQKREHFTDTEILNKDYQLSGSMFCKSHKDIMQELSQIGKVTQVWQSYNFMGWIIQ